MIHGNMGDVKKMANKTVKIILKCPECGKISNEIVKREWLFETSRGKTRLDKNNYFFHGTIEQPKYINCKKCDKTLIIVNVENIDGIVNGIKFCKSCGAWVESLISNHDQLCKSCDGV
jgi:DNA-directed RNA polymerase subunit RPC12/RpoP